MQQMQLSIPEPCHENWDAMTPTQQGRFCNACAKQVVDFSNMSDAEVLNYFSTITTEKVCGRAYPDQLERTISMPKELKKRRFWYWNYITMLFLFFSKTNNTKAQHKRMTVGSVQTVTAEQLNAARTANVNNALKGKVGEVAINQNSVINGVVKDINGDPIPFASVRIKKSNTGLNADANGAFSLKVNVAKDTLVISAASFKPMEVVLQGLKNYEFKLEKDPDFSNQLINVLAGGIFFRRVPEKTYSKYTLTFNVKDNATLQQVSKATLIIAKAGKDKIDTVSTNSKGVFSLDKVKRDESYLIKVVADGYVDQELEINARYFNEKKIRKEIFLHKKPAVVQPASKVRIMGGISASTLNSIDALYVVDGTIVTKVVAQAVDTNTIEDVSVLQGPAAEALFGPYGRNGAIIINTKKKQLAAYKSLDTVAVCSSMGAKTVMGGMIRGVTIKGTVKDSVKAMVAKVTGALKVYPDPVQRGNAFTLSLKLKTTGEYNVQVVNEAGKVLLQQQLVASLKEFTATIPTDMQWSSGVCFVRVLDKKGSVIITDKIVIR